MFKLRWKHANLTKIIQGIKPIDIKIPERFDKRFGILEVKEPCANGRVKNMRAGIQLSDILQ